MKNINYCTHCGDSVLEQEIVKNQVKCKSCLSVLNANSGEVISQPVMAVDNDPGDYPEGFNSELYDL